MRNAVRGAVQAPALSSVVRMPLASSRRML
jgi:hypothetical protein